MQSTISAAILAGGPGSRMGGVIKSNIHIDGQTIISRTIAAVKGLFDEIIIVTNNPVDFSYLHECRFTADHFINTGPIGGIHAALKASICEAVFVFAGDMPLIDRNLVSRQIELFRSSKCNILIPKINSSIEPLHSVFRTSLLPLLERYLSAGNGFAVREFINTVNTDYMELDDNEETRDIFSNINLPSDIAAAERILSGSRT